ncbi:hypothetical protein ACH4U3_13285 [Streptomyces griseoruber]|uniref:hypothetical protein n=1 Tax=Streptomyces griseoruber TaxID=1943 RepID=UPI003788CC6F
MPRWPWCSPRRPCWTLEVTEYPNEAAAKSAIDQARIYGALVSSGGSNTLIVVPSMSDLAPLDLAVRVQRRISAVGTIMVCRQTVSLGRPYAGQTVTVHVSDTTITVDLDGQARVIQRTTDIPVRHVKANKPHKVSDVV